MAKTISKDSTEQSQRERNYWLVRGEVADKTRHVMSVFVRIDYDRIASKVFPDDGVIVVDEKMRVLACASVYRARAVETGVVFYFVRSETPDSNSVLHGFDAPGPISTAASTASASTTTVSSSKPKSIARNADKSSSTHRATNKSSPSRRDTTEKASSRVKKPTPNAAESSKPSRYSTTKAKSLKSDTTTPATASSMNGFDTNPSYQTRL